MVGWGLSVASVAEGEPVKHVRLEPHVVLSGPAVRTVDLDSDVAAALTARSAPTLRLLSPRESVGHWSPPGIAWVW